MDNLLTRWYNGRHERQEDRHQAPQDADRSAHQGALAEGSARYGEAEVEEPYFPTSEDAVEANQAALAGFGQTNHALLRPEVLEGALGRAQNYWYYEQSLLKAAAALAHGVGQAQAFEDGNKRTAYWLTHHFLHENGLGHLAPDDDEELANHLIGYGEGTHSMDDTARMFEGRLGRDTGLTSSDHARSRQTIPFPSGHQSNILDPIHQELDPTVWDKPNAPLPVLKAHHYHWIVAKVWDVLDKAGYDGMDRWLGLVLTGSLTTFQFSDDSDCDVSVWVDVKFFPEWSRAEMIGLMIDHVDGTTLPGTPHPMQCFVVGKGMRREDLYKPGLRSAYDLMTKKWIVPPDKSSVHDVEREMNEAYTIALENADKMERLLRYEPQKAIKFWHQIHKRRQRDQAAGKGDYAPSNITYKMLNNRGLFPQISDVSGEYIAKVAAPQIIEGDVPTYHHGLTIANERFPGFLTVHPPEFYQPPHRVFTSPDGYQGAALWNHGDGRIEMAGVYNNDPHSRGAGVPLMQHAVAQGGNYLECFDQGKSDFSLPRHYFNTIGALPTGWYPWDQSVAPDPWDYERYGTPGFVTMTIPSQPPSPEEFEARMAALKGHQARVSGEVGADGVPYAEHTERWLDHEQAVNQEHQDESQ